MRKYIDNLTKLCEYLEKMIQKSKSEIAHEHLTTIANDTKGLITRLEIAEDSYNPKVKENNLRAKVFKAHKIIIALENMDRYSKLITNEKLKKIAIKGSCIINTLTVLFENCEVEDEVYIILQALLDIVKRVHHATSSQDLN